MPMPETESAIRSHPSRLRTQARDESAEGVGTSSVEEIAKKGRGLLDERERWGHEAYM